MIAAMDKNRVIGNGDKIPWHIPEDFKYFKEQTLNKPIIMGRATFESIHAFKNTAPDSPALPKRKNIIVTRQKNYTAEDCIVCTSPEQALQEAQNYTTKEIMVIGGAQIYNALLPKADRLYITEIEDSYEGDSFFPDFDRSGWTLTSQDQREGFAFNIYEKSQA